jgi:hypothetical protein
MICHKNKGLRLFFFVATSFSVGWDTTGVTVAGITSWPGSAANQFLGPYGVALDSSNTLYVSDQLNQRVQKWPANALTGTTVAGSSNAILGIELLEFAQPSGSRFEW